MHRHDHRALLFATLMVALLSLLLSVAAIAQPSFRARYIGSLSYDVAIPSGDANAFVEGNTSWLGLTLEGNWLVRPSMSVGFALGWQEFWKQTHEVENFDNGAISGAQYRHLNTFPILVTSRFFSATNQARVRPFLGIGAGAYYTRQLLDVGVNEFTSAVWQFGVAPEVGVAFAGAQGVSAQLRARYNYPIKSGDFVGGSKSYNYWNIGFGFAFAGY